MHSAQLARHRVYEAIRLQAAVCEIAAIVQLLAGEDDALRVNAR